MKRSLRPRKTATLPESIQRQLNMYALAASAAGVGILALSVPADCAIVYTPAHHRIPKGGSVKLDLNHDGVTDFRFVATFQTPPSPVRAPPRVPPAAGTGSEGATRRRP